MTATVIAIAGLQGSGKTTLARKLACRPGWTLLDGGQVGRRYLPDLFDNMSRWALEAQLAFFAEKAVNLIEAGREGNIVIVDRSLFEDYFVFGRYFREAGVIDDRSFELYRSLAEYFFSGIPRHALIIHCRCSMSAIETRLHMRGDGLHLRYPPGHLVALEKLYDSWISEYRLGALYSIDSEAVDFREDAVAAIIQHEIIALLQRGRTPRQLCLPLPGKGEQAPDEPTGHTQLLRPIRPIEPHTLEVDPLPPADRRSGAQYPLAYVAAPFTALATEPQRQRGGDGWFPSAAPHGVIGRGRFRELLLGIERSLKAIGVNVFLPHRDVNRWGNRVLSPEQVVAQCSRHVSRCDVFVGILGTSVGSHYEFGVANGLRRPSIIIRCAEISESFISRGVTEMLPNTFVYHCRKLSDIPQFLLTRTATTFLANFVPINVPSNASDVDL